MSTIQTLINELNMEAATTRKMLERVPNDRYDWQPHPKSMSIRRLATHIAELPSWVTIVLNTDELDFAKYAHAPVEINNTNQLLEYFEKNLASGRADLEKAKEAELDKSWTLRNGEKIFDKSPKSQVLRMAYCQVVHHRAQLGVYLRVLNVPWTKCR